MGGTALTMYVMRPILVPSAVDSSTGFTPEQVALTVANNGQLAMHNVEYQCETNKIVFGNTDTLDPRRFVLLFSERQIPTVDSGDQFRIDCLQAWHLFVAANRSNGILVYGDTSPGSRQFIWAFDILPNNSIRMTKAPSPGDQVIPHAFSNVDNQSVPITGVDMTATVSYSLFFGHWRFSKHFRYITKAAPNNSLVWVLVPADYPTLRDGVGGLKLILEGGPLEVTLVSR